MGKVRSSCRKAQSTSKAQVVELVDTLASGASARKGVEVQVLSWAPTLVVAQSSEYTESDQQVTQALILIPATIPTAFRKGASFTTGLGTSK
jgi:hypothetical protein